MSKAAHGLHDFVLSSFQAHVWWDGEGHDQFLGLRVTLLEIAQGNHCEGVNPWTDEQAGIVLKDADDLVELSVDADGFADRIFVGEERVANGRAQNDDRAGM